MFFNLIKAIFFGIISLILIKFTFDFAQESFISELSREIFSNISDMHYYKGFSILMEIFAKFGQFITDMIFLKGLPKESSVKKYPIIGRLLAEAYSSPAPSGPFFALKVLFLSFFGLFSFLITKPYHPFNVYAFFGVIASFRLTCFGILLYCIYKFITNINVLVKRLGFKTLIFLVIIPSYILATIANLYIYERLYTFWYIISSGFLTFLLYLVRLRFLLNRATTYSSIISSCCLSDHSQNYNTPFRNPQYQKIQYQNFLEQHPQYNYYQYQHYQYQHYQDHNSEDRHTHDLLSQDRHSQDLLLQYRNNQDITCQNRYCQDLYHQLPQFQEQNSQETYEFLRNQEKQFHEDKPQKNQTQSDIEDDY